MSVKNGMIARISIMFKMSEKNSMFVCDTQNRRNSSMTKQNIQTASMIKNGYAGESWPGIGKPYGSRCSGRVAFL